MQPQTTQHPSDLLTAARDDGSSCSLFGRAGRSIRAWCAYAIGVAVLASCMGQGCLSSPAPQDQTPDVLGYQPDSPSDSQNSDHSNDPTGSDPVDATTLGLTIVSATEAKVGETVAFSADALYGALLPEYQLLWDFGDGESAEGTQVRHSFANTGEYVVTLCLATGSGLATSCVEKQVDVSQQGSTSNTAPTADAGPNVTVVENSQVTLDGSGSSDPDGDNLAYEWTQLSGPTVTLTDADTATARFTAPQVDADTSLSFNLHVSDGNASHDDTVSVQVLNEINPAGNSDPVADAGADTTAAEHDEVVLDGSASSDADGDVLTYEWTQLSGPAVTLTDADTPVARFVAPEVDADATLTFQLRIDDGTVTSDDTVTVAILNEIDPNAGQLQLTIEVSSTVVEKGQSIAFAAATLYGASLPQGEYNWAFGDGSAAEGNQVNHSFSAPGTYLVTLCLVTGAGLTTSCVETQVTVTESITSIGVSISGKVTSNSAGLAGVTMGGFPTPPVTDATGKYSGTVPLGWTGKITPSKTGYTFSPASLGYSGIQKAQTGQNFTATPASPGRVLTALSISGPDTVAQGGVGNYKAIATFGSTTEELQSGVTWSVTGGGSISAGGVYTPPAQMNAALLVRMVATYSEGGVTLSGQQMVMVTISQKKPSSIQIAGPLAMFEGEAANYQATVTYDDDSHLDVTQRSTWTVTGGGSISTSGVYSAPATVNAAKQLEISASFTEAGKTVNAITQAVVYPRVTFTANPTSGARPLVVTFRAKTVNGGTLPEGTYAWNFDGTGDSGPMSTHSHRVRTYSNLGTYTATLTLTLAGLAGPIACSCEETGSDVAQITVANTAPTAVVDRYDVNEDNTLTVAVAQGVLANDTDPEGDALTAVLLRGALHGTLSLAADGSFIYTPAANYAGADTFVYKANDSIVDSAFAVVTITVASQNDVPVITGGDSVSLLVAEDSTAADPANRLSLTATDPDAGTNGLTWSITSAASHGTAAIVSGSPGSSGGTLIVSYGPQAGYRGPDQFTLQVKDPSNATDSIVVQVGVGGYLISGTISRPALGSGTEGASGVVLSLIGSGAFTGQNFTATTDASGNYYGFVPDNWSGTVAARDPEDWVLDPIERTYATVTADISGQNYEAVRNYYVDDDGASQPGYDATAAAGTIHNPYTTIQAAADVVKPGDTVWVRTGLYDASLLLTGGLEATPVVKITRDGTALRPIVFQAYGDGLVTINGRGINKNGIDILADYNTVSGFRVFNCKREGIRIFASWLTSGASQPPTEPPVFSGTPTGRTVSGCIVRECISLSNSTESGSVSAGILIQGQVDNCVIDSCISFGNGLGITLVERYSINFSRDYSVPAYRDPWPDAPRNCTVRNCLAYSNLEYDENSDGMGGRYLTGCVFEDNISYGNVDDNFDIVGPVNNIISGNIMFDANPNHTINGDGNGLKIGTRRGGGNVIRNNISFLNPRAGFDNDDGTEDVYENNVAYKNNYGMLIESDKGSNSLVNNIAYLNTDWDVSLSRDCMNAPPFSPLTTDFNYWGDGIPPFDPCTNRTFNDSNSLSYSNTSQGLQAAGDPLFVNSIDDVAQLDLSSVSTAKPGEIQALAASIRSQVRAAFALRRTVDGFPSSSPCIDRGIDVGLLFSGSAPDIGAVESP